ncbi:insulinase family protein [bacterium]|nr:insulinase family protein [bacterium]
MKKYVLLLFIILFGNCVFATDFNVYKGNNGHTIIVKQVSSNPIVIIDTWIKTGSINENDKNSGVSHFLEHLFFKGTEKNPAGTFDRILESKGAVTNAATSKDFTHYYIKIPSKDFDLALNLHADMLLNPKIPQAEMDQERKVVLEEIAKDKNSPRDMVYDNLNELIYKVHPYKREVIGDSKVIETISREEVLDYYYKNYAPENMVTIVIGDVNPDETAKKVKEAFNITPRKLEKHLYQKEPPITSQRIKEVQTDSNSAYMMIGFKGTNAVHSDEYALDILAAILGDGRSSRFYQRIKEQKQLANSISAANASYKDDGIFYINTNFQPENKDKLKNAIFEEVKNIQTNGVTDEEVQRAKNIIEKDTHYSRESISNVASEIGYTLVLTNDIKNYDNYLAQIKKVTPQDVKRVANKYLNENKCAISIVMPQNEIKKISNVKETVNHNAKLVKSAYNTDKYILDNGATLLINKHQNNDIVAISIKAKGGEFLEKIAGTGSLTASTMTKGTKNYSQLELSKVMEENGIEIAPSSNADYFVINVLTTKQQLPLTLKLLDEIVNNAQFNNDEIEKARKNILNGIKASRDVPLNKALENYKTELFTGTVYSNTQKIVEKTLPSVKRNDIIEFYNTIFYPKNLVISVNGDVDKQEIINELSTIFSKQNGNEFLYKNYENDFPTRTTKKEIVTPIKDLQTSWIILGWQTDGTVNVKDFATLQVIDAFLGTGMSSRLFRHLREDLGLAYQIGTGFSPNVLKGSFTMYIGTNPKNVTLAKDGMLKEIQTLKKEFVSEQELQDAKNQLIGKYLLALETNLDKASALSTYEITGRGFDFVNQYAKLINSVTPSDIIEVANKYFNDNYVESIVDKAK